MSRGHKMRLKRNRAVCRAESLGCHHRHPLPRVCLGEPGSRDVITDNGDTSTVPKWYVTAIIDICMTSPSVSLWKTVQHRQDYLSRWLIKFRMHYNTKTDPQTDDVWHILWRQREREAVATDFLRRPYATPEWWWFWHANKIHVYGITAFILNGLYRNMPVFLEDNFLILEHKVSFGFVPYPSFKRTNLQKSSTGKPAFESPTVMSVERSPTKGQSPRLLLGMSGAAHN